MSAPATLRGRENVYTCQDCGAMLVTVDRDEGTTPMFMRCGEYNADGCNGARRSARGDMRLPAGTMVSAMYPEGPRPPHIPAPTHEWYKPTDAELDAECRKHPRSAAAIREHVGLGGLLLRPIERGEVRP